MSAALALVQGSDAWRQARCGSLGASSIGDALAKTRNGWSASRAQVMGRLIAERLTGIPVEEYVSAAMRFGTATEPQARTAYAFMADVEVVEVGIIEHPTIAGAHASPDGLVGDDGIVEIRCPTTVTHVATLLGEPMDERYQAQVQWQLSCTGRQWCDWVSFDPRMPVNLQLFVQRIKRNDTMIARLEKEVREFLAEVDAMIAKLGRAHG